MNTLPSEYMNYLLLKKIFYCHQTQMFFRTLWDMCNFMNTMVDGRVLGLFSSDLPHCFSYMSLCGSSMYKYIYKNNLFLSLNIETLRYVLRQQHLPEHNTPGEHKKFSISLVSLF